MKNDIPHNPYIFFYSVFMVKTLRYTWIQRYHRNSVLISGDGCLEQIKSSVVKNRSENALRFRKHVLFLRRWIIARLHSVTEKPRVYKKVTGRRIECIRVIESRRGASHQIHHILMTSLYVGVCLDSRTRRPRQVRLAESDIVDRREWCGNKSNRNRGWEAIPSMRISWAR